MTFHRIDIWLETIEERTAAMQGTLHKHTMAVKHETQDGQSPTTTAPTMPTHGGSTPTFQHSATSLSDHAKNQLEGEVPPFI